MDESQLAIEGQIKNSPKEIREFLALGNWVSDVSLISKKNTFSPEQSTTLENEVLFVIIGFEFKDSFLKNIIENLGIPDILARGITQEINEKVFRQIENFLPVQNNEEMLHAGSNLLEDASGNADNIKPQLVKPALDILESQSDRTALEQKLGALNKSIDGNQVIQKSYPAQDPYREPIN